MIDNDSKTIASVTAGFGAFIFILAFILLIATAIYTSPLFCGSANERKMITSPQEIDNGMGYR